jgi:ATP-dependent 26S proteasome regulatory subunit
MDGVESRAKVIVIAATNRLDIIDTALLRPGRFDRLIKVPLPDVTARKQILTIGFKKMPLADDVNLDEIAVMGEGLSGAEMSLVCREAGLKALTFDSQIEKISNMDEFKIDKRFVEEALLEVKNRGSSGAEKKKQGVCF